ncbi:MAG: hypothetical protein U0269_15360 [Polyangiales bacterium]
MINRRCQRGISRAVSGSVFAICAVFFAVDAHAQQGSTQAATVRELRVTSLTGPLEVLSPQRREGAQGETLAEGQRVRVGDGGAATFSLNSGATIAAREHAEIQVFGDPSATATGGQPAPHDTIARRGSFVLTAPESGAGVTVATPSCTITLLRGEALVRVDARRTRVAVLRGRARVRAMGRDVVFRENQGAKIELNQQATARALVAMPVLRPFGSMSFTFGANVDVPIVWSAPRSTAAARWRVQVSRETDFSALVQERVVNAPLTTTTVSLPAGRYHVRVMGVDADELEGRWSAVQSFEVAGPRVTPGREGRVARVEVPSTMRCGLDSSPPALQPGPMELTPGRNHVLRCLRGESAGEIVEMRISAEESGPLQHSLRITGDVTGDQRTLALRLTDARGYGVPYATVRIEAPQGVIVERVVEGTERGTYTVAVNWPARIGRGRVRITVNDAVTWEETIEP